MRLRWLAIFCGLLLMACAAAASYAHADTTVTSAPYTTPFTLVHAGQLPPSARQVKITYGVGGCVQRDHVDVGRTAAAVTITVFETTLESSDGYAIPCPAPLPTDETVDLGGRLGNRMVLDGTVRYIQHDYGFLRHLSHRITFDKRIPVDWFGLSTAVVTSIEHHGTTLLAHIGKRSAPLPSWAVPIPTPTYTVPDFVGRPLGAAAVWADEHDLPWTAGRPPRLVKATGMRLLANYRITAQTPAAGSHVQPGPNTPVILTVKTR